MLCSSFSTFLFYLFSILKLKMPWFGFLVVVVAVAGGFCLARVKVFLL